MISATMDSTTASPPPAWPITFVDPPRNSPITPDRTDSRPNPCFNCNQEGHWFRDCPLRRSPPIPAAGAPPLLKCHCGGACLVLTSKTEKNPGRQFYRCPVLPKEKKCKFFKWCDEVIAGQINGAGSPRKWQQRNDVNSPRKQAESSSPMCSCGAGRARILTMEKGEYYGRQYYGCHIKKGQGACNFFQWRKEETQEGMGEVNVPFFILVPEEPNAQMLANGAESPLPSSRDHRLYHEPKHAGDHFSPIKMLANGVGETSRPERMTSDVLFVPESPLPSSRDHRLYYEPKHAGDHFSPIKMLANGVGETSRPERMTSDVLFVPESPLPLSRDHRLYYEPKHAGDHFSPIKMLANGVGETSRPERMTSDVLFVPESPLPSIRDHRLYHKPKHAGDHFSPIKKLSLDESSPSSIAATPRICLQCGKEAYWMSKCGYCFKCDIAETMAAGVGEEVGSAQEWMVPDVSVVPESPLSSIDNHQDHRPEHAGDGFSPIKRLSLDENFRAAAASMPRKCFKCGTEGQWMSEYGLCLKCDEAEMVAPVVGEANMGTGPERMPSDVWFVPEHLQSSREHRPNGRQDDQPTFVVHGLSPSKRLNLDESRSVLVALSPAKCLKCGKDAHWMSECQPCLKCGKVGHRMRDCTAYTVWW